MTKLRSTLSSGLCEVLSTEEPDDEAPSTTYHLCRSCGATYRTSRNVCPTCGGETFEEFDGSHHDDLVLNDGDEM